MKISEAIASLLVLHEQYGDIEAVEASRREHDRTLGLVLEALRNAETHGGEVRAAEVGFRISFLRGTSGLTKPDFARELGLSLADLQTLEAGNAPISRDLILTVCLAFQVLPAWLMWQQGPMRTDMDV